MITKNNQEFQEYVNKLSGDVWRKLATVQYKKSITEEKSHEDAMYDVYRAIIELSTKIID